MSDEVREIVYTAANFIFIAAVLFIAMMFFDLRGDYGRMISERVVAETRVVEANRYGSYDSREVTGYDVMNAITAYADYVPIYVTGGYNYIDKSTHSGRLYTTTTRISNPNWFKVSTAADPLRDATGLQSMYRQNTIYYAILVYDSDTPEQLAKDMVIHAWNDRDAPNSVTTAAQKIAWVNGKYNTARSTDNFGYQVSGVLFICIDVPGAALEQAKYAAIW